ncbi:hypothetical protein ACFLSA_04745 [Bacteroidota bacterium]
MSKRQLLLSKYYIAHAWNIELHYNFGSELKAIFDDLTQYLIGERLNNKQKMDKEGPLNLNIMLSKVFSISTCFFLLVGSLSIAQTIETYPVPEGTHASNRFEVEINGKSTAVLANQQHSFAIFSFEEVTAEVSVKCLFDLNSVTIRPVSAGITHQTNGNTIFFFLKQPRKLSIEVNDSIYLFLFADPLIQELPDKNDPDILYYPQGYYDLGGKSISLRSGQTLYIAGGAYLTNVEKLLIQDAENVTVCGRGVIRAPVRILNSHDVFIEGIIIAPIKREWMNKIEVSQFITYQNVKALTGNDKVPNYDGFDVMSGCHHIVFDDIFVRASDDVLSLKHQPSSTGH